MDSNQMNQNDQYSEQGSVPYPEMTDTDANANMNGNWQQMPYQQTTAPKQYSYEYQTPVADTKDGLCIAAFVLGIVGFFLNPIYVCSILAIVFGAIGMKPNGPKCNMAKVGLGLGIGSLVFQFLADFFVTIITLGTGAFSFCC